MWKKQKIPLAIGQGDFVEAEPQTSNAGCMLLL